MPTFSFRSIDVPAAAGTYTYIGVNGVDAAGEAVGYYGNVDGDGDGYFHGFTAADANGVTFDPPTSTNTDVVGITPDGEVFGYYTDNLNKQHGFVANDGVVTNVDIVLADMTAVTGVTATGEIFGTFADGGSVVGFTDNNGTYSVVNVAGALGTSIAGINAAGEIVGTYTDTSYKSHGFAIIDGVTQTINAPNAYSTSVVGVSANGVVVGNFQDLSNYDHAFIDSNGTVTQFDIAGASETQINAINDSGVFVGQYFDASGIHGFIDQNGVVTTVDVPNAIDTNILGIDAAGDIFGYYDDTSGNQHGFVGNPAPVVIESFGTTSLVQVGNNYDLDPVAGGTGPTLKYTGSVVTVGEFGNWTFIGAEQTGSGYEVALHLPGSDQYTVWNTDSAGNVVSNAVGGIVSGTSSALESLETSFHQDLNGDGTIGVPQTVIESFGATSLVQAGNNYDLNPVGGGTGPTLKYNGSVVTVGEFGSWTFIGAEQTGSGYEVALHLPGSDQYTVWNTDSAGNVVSNAVGGIVSGTSYALESLETSFQQDLNGDGTIGLPVIESFGATSLVQAENHYYLNPVGGGTGPTLKYNGSVVTVGEFGNWTFIGAEQTASGYEVALHLPGSDQYTVWNTDNSGNVVSNAVGGIVSGTSAALEAVEASFHQDLNGDGTIGYPVIESFGVTSLVVAGNNYEFNPVAGGTGPILKYGSAVTVGEYGSWTFIGAEQTASGYEVALHVPSSDQYTVWNTDGSGNVVSNAVGGIVSGASNVLESLETSFHQDLNGDGVIGATAAIATGTTLEVLNSSSVSVTFNGPTGTLILDHAAAFSGTIIGLTGNGSPASSDQIDLRDIAVGAGTVESYSGNASGGTLTITDSQNHTAHLALQGNYTGSTFTLSNDGSGGTIVIDPPVKDGAAAPQPDDGHFNFDSIVANLPAASPAPTVTIGGPGSDHFVFSAGAGAPPSHSADLAFDTLSPVLVDDHLAGILHDPQTASADNAFGGRGDIGHHDGLHVVDLHGSDFFLH